MKIIFRLKRHRYLARVSIFLITVALIAGMVGCGGDVEYDLTITSTAGGSVATPGEDTYTYNEGEVVSLVAEPEEGYRFVNWTGDVSTIAGVNDATTTITMNGDYSITANFEEEAVTFADSNLEAVIRIAIGKPTGPIYPSDLDGLTSFYGEQKGISNLTGLECATSLTDLGLYSNQISDISSLVNLTSLTWLIITANQISDISPLVDNEGLSEGDKVELSDNPLSSDSINIYIPQLEARGVIVEY